MTRNRSGGVFDGQTCFCCMCRCGDHKCFQQLSQNLPRWMQEKLKFDKDPRAFTGQKKESTRKSDLYKKTTYKQDFCEQQDIIDDYPLEQRRQMVNLQPFSKHGYVTNDSTYKGDFIPWDRDEQELCRAKLFLPADMLEKSMKDKHEDTTEYEGKSEIYNYYCPPHCIGDQHEESPENCLIGHKERFNLGPPTKRLNTIPEKSHHPFAKFTNYMLDYKGSKISPEKKVEPKMRIEKSICPLSSDTSYRSAFTCPPEMDCIKTKKEGQADTLKCGDGPMIQQTTSMVDYKDPDVSIHKPVKPPREVFQPPSCKMETTTTTGRTYQRWKDFYQQEKSKEEKGQKVHELSNKSSQLLYTTYQQDFNGLKSASCPCRVVEKYGSKVLEPHYTYVESEKLHDVFCFKGNNINPKSKQCPH